MSWNDLIGRRLDRYLILDELGRGGSSRVYRAHDVAADRDVAIKVIPNDAEDRVGFVRRFDREVEVVRQLDHPNIVAVHDRGETDDLVYLVMSLVGGGTLRARVGRPLPIGEACAAIAQMANALHHAHLRGIIHRDVKPSNMLISGDDPRHLLLTDFGIAKIQGHRGLTKSGTTIGTPEYMSPEQAEGKEIDPRADVYSLGCVLYEALAGRPPFVGATPVSVLYQQVHSRPTHLRTFNADVPHELGRIVAQALAKRPEERQATALRLAEALQPYAEGSMPALTMPEEPEAPRQRVTTHPSLEPGPVWGTTPTTGQLSGLGEEGLDALFPEDGTRPARRTAGPARMSSPSLSDLPSQPALGGPTPMSRAKPTIPLNQFRLPSKHTRPLELPLTEDGKLDIEALMARVELERSQEEPGPARQAWNAATPAAPYATQAWEAAAPDYTPGGQSSSGQGAPFPTAGGRASASRLSGPLPSRAPRSQPSDVWRPPLDDASRAGSRRRRSLPGGRMLAGAAAAAFLVVSLGIWLAVSASALGLTLGGHQSARATATATSTVVPTATPTATLTPTIAATATTDPQTALDGQAAASFRAVTLATFNDAGCADGNAVTRFSTSSTIVANLCAADSVAAGRVTVVIRQGGQILFTLVQGLNVSPGSHYWYSRYGLSAGTYDVLVTLTINGQPATAADITFTVG